MKQLLLILIAGCLLFSCNSAKKEDKNEISSTDAKTKHKANLVVNTVDSMVTWVDESQYDPKTVSPLRERLIMAYPGAEANYQASFAPEILAAVFANPQPYALNRLVEASSCDGFYTIERKQFRSGAQLSYASVSRNDQNKMKLFGLVKGEFSKNSKAFVLDFCNYLDTTCVENGKQKKVRLAAGLRIVYFVKEWTLSVGVDGLEKLAASKELNTSESRLDVSTIGWGQNDDALDGFKMALQKISVKNYPEACSALIDLLSAYKKATSLKPQVIPLE